MLWGQQPNPGRGSGSRVGRCESGTWGYFLSETPMRQAGSEISRTHRWLLQHKCPKTFLVSQKPIELAQSFLPNSIPREPHGKMRLAWNSAPFLLLFPLCFLCQGHPHAWEGLTWHQISKHLQRSRGAELAILAVMHFSGAVSYSFVGAFLIPIAPCLHLCPGPDRQFLFPAVFWDAPQVLAKQSLDNKDNSTDCKQIQQSLWRMG